MYQQPPDPNQPQYPPQLPYQQQWQQQPPQYQQSYGPPPMMPPPKRKRRTGLWITLGVIAFLALGGAIGNAFNPQAVSPTPTVAPAPTTAVGNPTVAPAPLTNKADIATEVQADIATALLQGDTIQAGYGAKNNAFALVGLKPPLTLSKSDQLTLVESDCFDGQKAIWTDPLLQNIGSMEVSVFTQDSQGLPLIVGDCTLHPNSASKIDWNNTDAFTAWTNKVYEGMMP